MENARKHRHIKLVATKPRRNYLVLEPNYHSVKLFSENLLTIEMRKTKILMKELVYLSLSISEKSKIIMYEFCSDYVKPKYEEKSKLCYMDTDKFINYMKTDDIFVDISRDVKIRFDTSNYELDRHLPKGKNNKVID